MGPGETAGIVVITVATIQGLISLIKYLIDKRSKPANGKKDTHLLLHELKDKVSSECGLNEKQSGQIHSIHELIMQKDSEGMPLVYFPRQSWGEVQKQIVENLRQLSEMQMKQLVLIERLEKKLEKLD